MTGWTSRAWGKTFGRLNEDRDEYTKVLWLFAYLFCVVSASTVGRTAADALFLSRFDGSQLSRMYLPQALSLIAAGFLFQRYGSRIRLDLLLRGLIPGLALLVLLSRAGVGADFRWVYPVIYVAYDVFNFLMVVCFWQFATALLDQRKAKRMIPLVGSGGITGGIVSGFGLQLLVPLLGTSNLIYLYAGLQLAAWGAVAALLRRGGNPADLFRASRAAAGRKGKSASRREPQAEGGLFRNVPHLADFAVLSAAIVMTLMLVDYQFKVILGSTLSGDALAGFMGSFYGFSGLCALGVQVFVSGRLLGKFGVMTALLVFPLVLLVGSAGLLLLPVLAMAVVVKGSDKVVGDTVYSSVSQLVMFPIPPEWRSRAKSFMDGVVRNGAKGLSALALLLLSPLLDVREISYVVIALLAVSLIAAVRVKGTYLKLLLSTLERKDMSALEGAELDLVDPASRQLLTQALASPDHQQARYALRVLGELDGFDLTPHLPALFVHPAPQVRVDALAIAERTTPPGLELGIAEMLRHEADEGVQAQALLALCAYADDTYLEAVTERLETGTVTVKAGAIAGLIKYYGIDGMFRAVGTLKELLHSTDESERIAVASLFGRIGIRTFYKPLRELLEDPSAAVRRSALRSAAALQSPELIPTIVPLLRRSGTRRDAIEALAAYEGGVAFAKLLPYFDADEPPLHLPKVFERIGTREAADALAERYESADFAMRDKLLEALSRMRSADGEPADKRLAVQALLELDLWHRFGSRSAALAGLPDYADAVEAVEQIREGIVRRVFKLLGLLHDVQTMDAVYLNWTEGDAQRQANAAEVLDQVLQGGLRTEMARLIAARRPIAAAVAAVSAAGGSIGASELAEQVQWLRKHGDEWLRQVLSLRDDAAGAGELREQMARIRLLRQVPLFQGLADRDLAQMARGMQEVSLTAGETLFSERDSGDSLFLIRNGRAGVFRSGRLVVTKGPGDCIGQTAILTQRKRTATVKAETPLALLRLDSADFYEAMFDRTEMALDMMKQLSRRLRDRLAENSLAMAESASAGTDAGPEAGKAEAAAAAAGPEAGEAGGALRPAERETAAAAEGLSGASLSVGVSDNREILRRVLVLRKIELFAHLGEEDFIRLAHLVDELVYEPDEAVCRAGEFGDRMYGIIEGRVRVHLGSETFAELGEGECFGEMAVIDSGPRSADCTASERTVVLQLSRDQVFSFCFQEIDVLKSMVQVMADRLRGML